MKKEKVTGKMMNVVDKSKKLGIYSKNFKVEEGETKMKKSLHKRLYP